MTDYIAIASEHIESLYPLIIYSKPRLMDLPPGTIIGTWAYSIPGEARFILDNTLEVAPGVLPGDLSRAWIRDQYKLPFRRRKNQMERGYPVPLHARRGKHGDCSYVDIKGAYLHILALGYDVEYRRQHYIGAEPREVPDQIAHNKFSYAIAVAMSGSKQSNLEVMGKEGVFHHRPLNLYSNPCLFCLAQDTLNAIGSEMLAVLSDQVVYANTDGYIVKAGYEQYAIDIIESWGFRASIKHRGDTIIRGVASYRVGDFETARFDRRAEDYTGPLMDRDARRWLKTRWVMWSKKLHSAT